MTCTRCGAVGVRAREMTKNGEPARLGLECGCFGRWLHWRELKEFEVTGVIASG